MSLMTELENKVDGSVVLIDTSVITPYETLSLTDFLYEGIDGLEQLDPLLITNRMSRLQDISRCLQHFTIAAIPEVCAEMHRHISIINHQHSSIQNDLRIRKNKDIQDEAPYYQSLLDIINSYNIEFYRLHKKLENQRSFSSSVLRGKRYNEFMEIARRHSQDLIQKSIRSKEAKKHAAHIGVKLETDLHLMATSFMLAYLNPVYVVTKDDGIATLISRCYEELTRALPVSATQPITLPIPQCAINVLNTLNHDLLEYKRNQRVDSAFLDMENSGLV